MSEEEKKEAYFKNQKGYLKVNEQKREITTKDGNRYILSINAASQLGCKLSDLEKGITNAEEFNKLRKFITISGEYKLIVKTDEKGNYIQVKKKGINENVDEIKIVPLHPLRVGIEKQIPPDDWVEVQESLEVTSREEERALDEAIELANTQESISPRADDNTDTKEIDLSKILNQDREKKGTRRLVLEQRKDLEEP